MCSCFHKTIEILTKEKPRQTATAWHGARSKKLEEGYFILILSKHILKPSKQNWNGPQGKHILIQILVCFSLTQALIFIVG